MTELMQFTIIIIGFLTLLCGAAFVAWLIEGLMNWANSKPRNIKVGDCLRPKK